VKKFLGIAIATLISSTLQADIKWDPTTCVYYSIPMTADINQREYNDLYWKCYGILFNLEAFYIGAGILDGKRFELDGETVRQQIFAYLRKVNTHTAYRFIEDIKKLKKLRDEKGWSPSLFL
jgi:hypothetical protein